MIRFNKPLYTEAETKYAQQALNGKDFSQEAKAKLANIYGEDNIYLTGNGSSAIEMAFALLDLPKGSEVIIPTFNFPSIANSIMRNGLKPVLCDISPTTYTLDMDNIKKHVTDNTSCIAPVHYGGISIDMDELISYAKQHDIMVVEDAALSIGGMYKDSMLGTIGNLGIVSFHETKNVSCGVGGALIVNDKKLQEKAPYIYDNGTNRKDFLEGKVQWYSWQDVGMNVAMPNISTAVLSAQLDKYAEISSTRSEIFEYYVKNFSDIYTSHGIKYVQNTEFNTNNHHVFYLNFPTHELREKVRHHLQENDIQAHVHYMPLHLSKMGKSLGYRQGDFPVTEKIWQTELRLPLHNCMNLSDAAIVVDTIMEVL